MSDPLQRLAERRRRMGIPPSPAATPPPLVPAEVAEPVDVLAKQVAALATALRRAAPLEADLAADLTGAAEAITRRLTTGQVVGVLLLTRPYDWIGIDPPPFRRETGDDETDEAQRVTREGTPQDEDHRLAAAAGRYHAEVEAIFTRLWSDTARLGRFHAILPQPNQAPAYKPLVRSIRKDCNRLTTLAAIVAPAGIETLASTGGEPGCWSCARTHVRPGIPRWNEVWRTVDLKGTLRPARPLCEPCARFTYSHGRVPTTAEVEVKAATGKWPKEAA